MATFIPIISTVATIFSTISQFSGQQRAAKSTNVAAAREQQAREFEAKQLAQQAGQETASAQRQAAVERHRADLIASRALAISAAGGQSGSDPAVLDLLSDIEGEGAYRAGVALYEGEERGRQLGMGESAKLYEGQVALQAGRERSQAYKTASYGSLLQGAGTLFGRYGQGGFKSQPKTNAALSNGWFDTGTSGYGAFG